MHQGARKRAKTHPAARTCSICRPPLTCLRPGPTGCCPLAGLLRRKRGRSHLGLPLDLGPSCSASLWRRVPRDQQQGQGLVRRAVQARGCQCRLRVVSRVGRGRQRRAGAAPGVQCMHASRQCRVCRWCELAASGSEDSSMAAHIPALPAPALGPAPAAPAAPGAADHPLASLRICRHAAMRGMGMCVNTAMCTPSQGCLEKNIHTGLSHLTPQHTP